MFFFRLEAKVAITPFFLGSFRTMAKLNMMLLSVVFICALVEFCYGSKVPQRKNFFALIKYCHVKLAGNRIATEASRLVRFETISNQFLCLVLI